MIIRINHHVTEEFILKMIMLYIFKQNDALGNKTKKDFVAYMKDQIEDFGSDDFSQFGENHYSHYKTEQKEAERLFNKWY